jgi:hypothetical protein
MPYYPLPNFGPNLLVTEPNGSLNDDQVLTKADWLPSTKDHLTARYFRDEHGSYTAGTLPGFTSNNDYTNQTIGANDTHTFGPNWIMTASYSLLLINRQDVNIAPATMQDLGAQVPLATKNQPGKLINVTITGYTGFASSGGQLMRPVSHEGQVSFNRAAGRHLIGFGTAYLHTSDALNSLNASDDGKWNFSAARTAATGVSKSGEAIASFLLGLPATFTQAANVPDRYILTTFDAWIQDDFRVSRDLTLNLGMRWEPALFPYDSALPVPGFLAGRQSVVAPKAPRGVVYGGDPGIKASIVPNYRAEFSPRIGFAWNIGGDRRTVIRAGYGIFRAGTHFDGLVRNMSSSAPFNSSISINNPPSTANPYAGYQGTIPFPYSPPATTDYTFAANSALRMLDATAHPGYTQSWNLTVERQITGDAAVSLAYVGNHALGIMSRYEANPALFGPGATVGNENSRRLYPGIGQLTLGTSYDFSHYHALQAQVTKRTRQGLNLMVSYTWSKSMDIDSSGTFGTALAQGPRDPFHLRGDYALSDFNATNQFTMAAMYDLPKLRQGPAALRAIANGWQANGMVIARSGFPVTCRSGVDNSLTGIGNDNCDQIGAQSSRPAGTDFMKKWFNTDVFTTNTVGTYGDAGRNDLRRPGLLSTNASLFRHLRLTERMQAEFRAEAFNVLNHANFRLFYSPGAYQSTVTLTSPTFGQITYADDPRLMQLALKLRF